MSRRIIFRTPTTVYQRQPLLQSRSSSSSFSGVDDGSHSASSSSTKRAKFGEFCGGTTAECAAVCCCFPCGIANLLVLVIYKVPAGLCRRAFRQKRRQKLQKKGLFQPRNYGSRHCGCEDIEFRIHPTVCIEDFSLDIEVSEEADKALFELEEEMWERFHGTGFWRSPSQREREPSTIKEL